MASQEQLRREAEDALAEAQAEYQAVFGHEEETRPTWVAGNLEIKEPQFFGNFGQFFGNFGSQDEAVLFAVEYEKKRFPEAAQSWATGSAHRGTLGKINPDPCVEFFDDLIDCGWAFYPVTNVTDI